MSQHSYFITLTLVSNKVQKNLQQLLKSYDYFFWVEENGKTGNNRHFHIVVSGFPQKIRTDNLTKKFKKHCYDGVPSIPENTRRLVKTKYVYDLGTIYNSYFKKEGGQIHIKGFVKDDLDKLGVKTKVAVSKIMSGKVSLTKQNAPYIIREYATEKKLYDKDGKLMFQKTIDSMIKDDYIVHHLYGKPMDNIRACLNVLEGGDISYTDLFYSCHCCGNSQL